MRKRLSFVMLAATVAISMAFWANMVALIAWALVFLTGSLHGSGLTAVPALSFWESMVTSLAVLSLIAFLLRVGRVDGEKKGR